MSTLVEIEAAVAALPPEEQRRLLHILSLKINEMGAPEPGAEDPLDTLVGSLEGPPEATGRQAEEILYGRQ